VLIAASSVAQAPVTSSSPLATGARPATIERHATTRLSTSAHGPGPIARVPRAARDRWLAAQFGERLRTLREDRELSQEALADRAGVHRTYVGRVERGEATPTLYSIVRLAGGLGIDPADLVRGLRQEEK
jgi:ribosome-binding protein aMBF1 (putative translation factor)